VDKILAGRSNQRGKIGSILLYAERFPYRGSVLKVLLVVDHLGPGGSQRQIVNLATGLADAGHDVSIFTYHPDDHYGHVIQQRKIRLVNVVKKGKLDFGAILALRKLIKEGDFDVHCSYLFAPSTYLLLASLFEDSSKNIVSERASETIVPTWYKYVRKLLYRRARAIVANSQHQSEFLKAKYRSLSDRFCVIFNGVKLSDFDVVKNERSVESLNLLGVGKVSKTKNPVALIEALHILKQESDLKPRVTWLGQFEDRGGQREYYERCNVILADYGLEDQWVWKGAVKDVPSYYPDIDLMVHASYAEGFPNAICEALASGTPVVASRVYDHPSIVGEDVQGYLFDPDDPAELATKIRRFVSLSSTERADMGRRARKTAEERFSNEVMVKKFIELFRG